MHNQPTGSREEIETAIENLKNYRYEQALKEYEQIKPDIVPKVHNAHIALKGDGKPFLQRYSNVEYASRIASRQIFIDPEELGEVVSREAFENAIRELIHELENHPNY